MLFDNMPTIVIAGASGFIGRWFIQRYRHQYRIIALSRTEVSSSQYPEVEWRQADLYSLSSTTAAMKGAGFALYLVHSMQPSTRLNQSSFEDTDLLLADNFARAAMVAGFRIRDTVLHHRRVPRQRGSAERAEHLRGVTAVP